MDAINSIAIWIADHWIASVILLLLYVGYEIAIRRIPTDSPWYSITEIIGQFFKMLGKMVIKILGENMSKTVVEDTKGKPVVDPKTKKPIRKPFSKLFRERESE